MAGFDFVSEAELIAIVTRAMSNVAKRVQKDLLAQARKNIKEYYAQYNPDVYDRTFNLGNNVKHLPILINSSGGNSISFKVGFQYDGSGIGGYPDGRAEPSWVFNNFLKGVHPKTTKGYEYVPETYMSQNEMMDNFVNSKLQNKIDSYIQSELMAALSKLM
jgi:hypothetical protein